MKRPDALASKGQAVEEWVDLHFFRPVGLRLAAAALPTRVSADQITIASLVVGLAAGHLFVYRGALPNVLGIALFIVSDILDSADGQLARLRGHSTRLGRILDGLSDSLRFLNLYVHLGLRLVLAGGGWLAAALMIAALFSHSRQSAAADFMRGAFLRFHGGEESALDLPEDVGPGDGGFLDRLGRWLYRDYLRRQVGVFPATLRLARRLGPKALPEELRRDYERLQGPIVAKCAWIGQNIRWALLGTAAAGWPSGFFWITLGPLNLVLVPLLIAHERNATRILAQLPPEPVARAGAPRRLFRGAVLGLGGVARQAHLPAFLKDPRLAGRMRIVATVDGSPEVAPYDGIPQVLSPDDLLEFEPIDFVDICTPTASHVPLTLQALRSGYHVLCEKPVAVTRAEADRVARAARRAGKIVMPCHQYRYNPVWRQIREWLSAGALGRWHLAEFQVHRVEADRGKAAGGTPWRGLRDQSRGGVLLDHGTHLIYALMDLAGPPAAVQAWTGQVRHLGYDVEDTAHLILEYPGSVATLFLTWAGHRRENRIRIIGERGTIEWDGGVLTLERNGAAESVDYTAQSSKAAYVGWFGGLFEEFADAIEREEGERHLADIRQVAAVLEAAYASAGSKRPKLVTVVT